MQPTAYTITINFRAEEVASVAGRSTVRTAALDVELQNIAATLAGILTNLPYVLRDDNTIKDDFVTPQGLSPETLALVSLAGFTWRDAWATGSDYVVKDLVYDTTAGALYIAVVAHTAAATLAADVAANNMLPLVKANSNSSFINTLLDDPDAATARATLGATTVGDALFTAADVAAARTVLGVTDMPAGMIFAYAAGSAIPAGTLACDGSNRDRTTYAALFGAIGETWGAGNGSTTFGTPDLRRRSLLGSGGTGTAMIGNTVGVIGGEENHRLDLTEMPVHAHASPDVAAFATWANASMFQAYAAGTDGSLVNTTADAGGGGSHNNIQPCAVVLWLIKT